MMRGRKILILLFVIFFVASCAARPRGVYHRVKKDETLWRIARAYSCDVNTIVEANNLGKAEVIEEGSLLFIPGATGTVSVKPPVSKPKPAVTVKKKKPATTRKTAAATKTKTKSYKQRFIWPLKGKISSKFGLQGNGMRNNGIRIDAKEGTPVKASAGGTVILSAPIKYYGETIIIKHSNVYSTVYSNLKKRIVGEGHVVKQGQQIAFLGRQEKSGRECLYFEVRYKNGARNPLKYLP
jgi:murein DD-endopeptidase MepM/ murein hydrolase activator NlpD